ncbi:MAG: hypothetical protein ACK4UJ_00520 [Leptonema sp. (in: bacteria)]
MRDQTQFSFIKMHKVSLNILPDLYQKLKMISYTNFNHFLEYLYEKYKQRILSLKISPFKKDATTQYQPKKEGYKIVVLKIAPSLWRKFWELRLTTGYSISFIIRVFLEWELESRGQNIVPLLPSIVINQRELELNYPNFFPSNNYICEVKWMRHNDSIYIDFVDDS